MLQDHFKEIGVGVMTTLLTGALAYFFNFFHSEVPQINEKIKVLEHRFEAHHDYLERIDDRIQKLYEVYIEQK